MSAKKAARAFTLIELLIVVAIIAILAAVAVPNFLEAQTRAKVSRVQADMRTVRVGLESYAVDFNSYPPNLVDADGRGNIMNMAMGKMPFVPYTVTTPVAYIQSVPLDTFNPKVMADHVHSFMYFNATNTPDAQQLRNHRAAVESRGMMGAAEVLTPRWTLVSSGPDQKLGAMAQEVALEGDLPIYEIMVMGGMSMGGGGMPPMMSDRMGSPAQYDPTNGSVSEGDIVIFGP